MQTYTLLIPCWTHTLNTPISLIFDFDECGRPAHMRPFAIPMKCFFVLFLPFLLWCCICLDLFPFVCCADFSIHCKTRPRRFHNAHISIHRIRVFVQTDNISIFQAHSLELFKWPKCKQILFENNIHKYDWHNVNNYVASQEVCFNKNWLIAHIFNGIAGFSFLPWFFPLIQCNTNIQLVRKQNNNKRQQKKNERKINQVVNYYFVCRVSFSLARLTYSLTFCYLSDQRVI